jgi:hypothetical protein
MGGWSDVFAYVSIRDAYLPGFKILPSVQFSARMWHVAILVTSGLCRTIYWPPSAASTIYLPSPIFPFVLTITRYLFPLRRFFLSPSLSPPSPLLSRSFSLPPSFSISTVAYVDRVESTLERYCLSTWTHDISNFRPRYFAISTVTELQTRGLVNNLMHDIRRIYIPCLPF